MNVCTLAETYPVVFDLGTGLFQGFLVLGILLAVLAPISMVSGVPAQLLIDLFYYSLANTVFRVSVLGFSLLAPAILTFMTLKTFSPLMTSLACLPDSALGVNLQMTASLGGFLLFEYLISFIYLDSSLGLGITPIKKLRKDGTPNPAHPVEVLRTAEKRGFLNPAIPEHLLRNIVFARGRPTQTELAITYGGLLVKPRIVLAPHFQELYSEELQVPLLLHEIAFIRNRASFFFGFITALKVTLDKGFESLQRLRHAPSRSLALLGLGLLPLFSLPRTLLRSFLTFNSPTHEISNDTYALSTFIPEVVVHTLGAMLGDFRKIPKEPFNFHEQTFELIKFHLKNQANQAYPAIRARILWASQFCTGGGYFNEAVLAHRQGRSKKPRILVSMLCIFTLIFPLYTETKASLLYHILFQKKIALPHSSPQQEKTHNAFSH